MRQNASKRRGKVRLFLRPDYYYGDADQAKSQDNNVFSLGAFLTGHFSKTNRLTFD